jgi:hypothetical protein
MRTQTRYLKSISFFLILFFLTNTFLCQVSLYLLGAITGECNANRTTDVNRICDVKGNGYDDFMVTNTDNTVRLYFGPSNLNLMPSVIFHYPDKDSLYGFGEYVGIGYHRLSRDEYSIVKKMATIEDVRILS